MVNFSLLSVEILYIIKTNRDVIRKKTVRPAESPTIAGPFMGGPTWLDYSSLGHHPDGLTESFAFPIPATVVVPQEPYWPLLRLTLQVSEEAKPPP